MPGGIVISPVGYVTLRHIHVLCNIYIDIYPLEVVATIETW